MNLDNILNVLKPITKLPDLNHVHYIDIKLRINGQDKHYEGDWLKHVQILHEQLNRSRFES